MTDSIPERDFPPIAGIDVIRARCAALRLEDIDPLWAESVRKLAAVGLSMLQKEAAAND